MIFRQRPGRRGDGAHEQRVRSLRWPDHARDALGAPGGRVRGAGAPARRRARRGGGGARRRAGRAGRGCGRVARPRGRRPRGSSTTSARSSTSTAGASRRPASCTSTTTAGVREARQPRRPGARGDPQQRRGPLLLPRRQGRPHRAAHVPQRVSVAVAAAAEGAGRVLRRSARPRRAASPASRRRPGCSSRRTACATGTSSGPTARPACCSRRASSTSAARSSSSSRSPTSRSASEIDREMVRPSWPPVPPDWQVRAVGTRRRRAARHRLDGRPAAAGVRQDRRGLPHAARQAAAGRAPRLLGRPRRGLGVRRAVGVGAAPDRPVAAAAASTSSSAGSTTTSSPCWARRPPAAVRQIAAFGGPPLNARSSLARTFTVSSATVDSEKAFP